LPDGVDDTLVAIGRVAKPRGIHGEAHLVPMTDFPERFEDLESVVLQKHDGTRLTVHVERVKAYGNRLAIKFRGYRNPEAVSTLRGAHLLVPRDETYPLPEDVFYVFDIIGLDVVTEAGDAVGRVKDVLSLPAQDVYVVDRDGKELLLPAVRDVLKVEMEARRIVVKNLDGLL
jgi:16S rRNA processing protein RimM